MWSGIKRGSARLALFFFLAAQLLTFQLAADAIPKALAQVDPNEVACLALNDQGLFNSNFTTAQFTNKSTLTDLKTDISLKLTAISPGSIKDPTAKLYRKTPGQSLFQTADTLPLQKNPTNPSIDEWNGQKTDTLSPVPDAAATKYLLALEAKDNSNRTVGKCFRYDGPPTGGDTNNSPSLEKAKSWFNGYTATVGLIISERQREAPTFIVPADRNGRPEIIFRLTDVINTYTSFLGTAGTNVDWLVFKAHLKSDDSLISNIYALGDDRGPDTRIYYVTNSAGLIVRDDPPEAEKLTDIKLKEGTGSDTLDQLFRYVMNDSKDDGKNCANGFGEETGPKKGADKSPKILTKDGKYARELNGNCLNQNIGSPTADDIGWPAWWNVKTASQSADAAGGACGVSMILGAFSKAGVGGVIGMVAVCTVQWAYNAISGSAEEVVKGSVGSAGSGQIGDYETELRNPNSAIITVWKTSLGIVNILIILALLAIAFANILHLNINTYAAKKALPALALGVIGANASLLLMRFLADVTNAVSNLALGVAGIEASSFGVGLGQLIAAFLGAIGKSAIGGLLAAAVAGVATGAGGLLIIAAIIFAIYYIFLIFIFAFALFKRIVIVYALTMLAPIAFICYGIPSFQQYFAKWWDNYLRYLFMFPAILFGMAMVVLLSSKIKMSIVFTAPINTTGLIYAIILFTAATLVLKIPGLITKGAIDVTGAAKKAFGIASQAPGGFAAWRQGKLEKQLKNVAPGSAEAKRLKDKAANWTNIRVRSNLVANPKKTWLDWAGKNIEGQGKDTARLTGMAKGQTIFKNPGPLGKAPNLSRIWYRKAQTPLNAPFLGEKMAWETIYQINRENIRENFFSPDQIYGELQDGKFKPTVDLIKKARNAINNSTGLNDNEKAQENILLTNKLMGASTNSGRNDFVDLLYKHIPRSTMSDEEMVALDNDYALSFVSSSYAGIGQKGRQGTRAEGAAAAVEEGDFSTLNRGGGRSRRGGPRTYGEARSDLDQEIQYIAAASTDQRYQRISNLVGKVSPVVASQAGAESTTGVPANTHFQNLADRWEDTLAAPEDAAGLQEAIQNLRTETISAIRQNLTGDVKNIAEELNDLASLSLSTPASIREAGERLRDMSKDFQWAAEAQVEGGNLESIQQKLVEHNRLNAAAAEVSQQATAQLNGLNQEQLAQLLSGSIEEIGGRLEEAVRPAVEKMTEAMGLQNDAAAKATLQNRALQDIKNALTGRDRNSLAMVVRQRFNQLGETVLRSGRDMQVQSNVTVQNQVAAATQPPAGQTVIKQQVTQVTNPPPVVEASEPVLTAPETPPQPAAPPPVEPPPPSPEVSPNLPPDTQP